MIEMLHFYIFLFSCEIEFLFISSSEIFSQIIILKNNCFSSLIQDDFYICDFDFIYPFFSYINT